jgi:hypothetical protein
MNLALGGTADEVVTISNGATGECAAGLTCTYSVANGATLVVTQTGGGDTGTWSGGTCSGSTVTPCTIVNMTAGKTVTWTH